MDQQIFEIENGCYEKNTEFPTVAEKRNYMVLDVTAAKKLLCCGCKGQNWKMR